MDLELKVPDVLALRLDEAEAVLKELGLKYEIKITQPPRLQKDNFDGVPTLYVIRQSIASDNTICLISSYRIRKEVQ